MEYSISCQHQKLARTATWGLNASIQVPDCNFLKRKKKKRKNKKKQQGNYHKLCQVGVGCCWTRPNGCGGDMQSHCRVGLSRGFGFKHRSRTWMGSFYVIPVRATSIWYYRAGQHTANKVTWSNLCCWLFFFFFLSKFKISLPRLWWEAWLLENNFLLLLFKRYSTFFFLSLFALKIRLLMIMLLS